MNAIAEKTSFKSLGAYLKAQGDQAPDAPNGFVEGVANAFEVDRYGDLVLPEAMANAVPKFMKNPVMTFGHAMDGNPVNGTLPAGTVLSIGQDATGSTIFRARWAGTEDAQKVRALYKAGDMRAFSIHFLPYGDSLQTRQPSADEVERFPGVQRVITSLELIEIACCVVPVNAGSLATNAKSLNLELIEVGKLKRVKKLSQGERAMAKSILTGDMRKSITTAHKAFDEHTKAMEGVAGHLEELAESKEGGEADHGAMCVKAHEAFTKSEASHKALGEAVKAMHKAITNTDTADDSGEPDGDEPDDAGEGSPAVSDPEQKAILEGFTKAFND